MAYTPMPAWEGPELHIDSGPKIETPRGRIIQTSSGVAKLEWDPSAFEGGNGSWQDNFSAAQGFVDSEILRLCDPYTPFRTGMLIKSGLLGTEIGSGTVRWIAPYARRQYYMKRLPGSETGPLRGPLWFERMKQVHGQSIISGAKRIIGRSK